MAVYRAVKKITGVELDIKWVNDLYHNGKKVCGIHTEAVTDFESGNIEFAVVGIGLNIFEAADGYPDSLKGIAGGIYENREAAGELDRSRLAAEIVNALLEETREPTMNRLLPLPSVFHPGIFPVLSLCGSYLRPKYRFPFRAQDYVLY